MLLGYGMPHGRQHHDERQWDVDRLVEQFQELFRQIDQEKKQRS